MPMSEEFEKRLLPNLKEIADHYGTPFYIYDESGIRKTAIQMRKAFAGCEGFRGFYAVKANCNPAISYIMKNIGFGFDCSSKSELIEVRAMQDVAAEDILFTASNPSQIDLEEVVSGALCMLNLDDVSLIDAMSGVFPRRIFFRYNPGLSRASNGDRMEEKWGVPRNQIVGAYERAREMGASSFGLHTMLSSDGRKPTYYTDVVKALLSLACKIKKEIGIELEFISISGGIGIPYTRTQKPINISVLGFGVRQLLQDFKKDNGYVPKFLMGSGRYLIGPHGVLVTQCTGEKRANQDYRMVDVSCMASLMPASMYGEYHYISVFGGGKPKEVVNIIGPLCGDHDVFATQRDLPRISKGDLIMIHDTGAYCYSMSSPYGGQLRPKELLLRDNGMIELIRREETLEDYFATFRFKENSLKFN